MTKYEKAILKVICKYKKIKYAEILRCFNELSELSSLLRVIYLWEMVDKNIDLFELVKKINKHVA
jgi:hypothetical protein